MDSNINNMIDLKLSEGEICCKSCNYSWKGFSQGFSRGHIVFKKDNQFIFVGDDIWYGFPNGIYFDLENIFEQRGWLSISRCPICKCRYNNDRAELNNIREVECYKIVSDDFECIGGTWILSQRAIVEKNL